MTLFEGAGEQVPFIDNEVVGGSADCLGPDGIFRTKNTYVSP